MSTPLFSAMMRRSAPLLALGLAALLIVPMSGCRGDRSDARPRQFFPDMDKQPKWGPQNGTEFFAMQDGSRRTQRTPPANTVAFGRRGFDPVAYQNAIWAEEYLEERASFLAEDDRFFRGIDGGADDFLDRIPVPVTAEMLDEGQNLYNINCVSCHGELGDGKGMVAKLGMNPIPANLHEPRFTDPTNRSSKDGHMFHVIRDGLWSPTGANRMPAYGHNISASEAWSIVAYIRALQASQAMPADSGVIPQTERDALNRRRPPTGGQP